MTGRSPLLGRGASTLAKESLSSEISGQLQEAIPENASRSRWRLQNRSSTDTLSVWIGPLGSEVLIAILQPGLKPDAGDSIQSTGTRDRISVSSSGSQCPYFCQEVV